MAIAQIPPLGPIKTSLERQKRRIRENTTLDPTERYKLREERMQAELKSVSSELVRQAIQRGSKR